MKREFRKSLVGFAPGAALLVGGLLAASPSVEAQSPGNRSLYEPIYRVAHEEPIRPAADQATQVASRIVPSPANVRGFDLEQRPGEHPLMPALRVAKQGLAEIDSQIQDYQAILYKQERIDGELQGQEVAFVKVRHNPFSVYLYFLAPSRGRECVYVEGPDGAKGELQARDCGWRRRIGTVSLHPDGRMAMKGQKYPIYKLGIRNLTSELIDVASQDIKYADCEVRTSTTELGTKSGPKRPVTVIEVVHPTARTNFRFHKAQVFIDNELRVPIRYAAYLWPENPGEQPPLEEAYTYTNLKVNNGFTDADFDPNNPEIFKD
ncbi:MAG: DUF1571 domain-containing protein [Planctomycetales bacterium]|nr:DUF1571 domain-containing protein [Planctomycetales bacterium]